MQTTLTSDDFNFIIAALNDASLEIVEKQEVKQEQMYNRIEIELQGVLHQLQIQQLSCSSSSTDN
jgi:citrate lyase gamma subunit